MLIMCTGITKRLGRGGWYVYKHQCTSTIIITFVNSLQFGLQLLQKFESLCFTPFGLKIYRLAIKNLLPPY